MSAPNRERFDESTGEVFARLYSSFPVPGPLKAGDYVATPSISSEHVCADVPSEEAEFSFACIRWPEGAGTVLDSPAEPHVRCNRLMLPLSRGRARHATSQRQSLGWQQHGDGTEPLLQWAWQPRFKSPPATLAQSVPTPA